MRKRNYRIEVKLDQDEFNHLMELVEQSRLSRESYIRMLISGVIPKAAPSKELLEITRLLRNIANNINQVAKAANSNCSINVETYKDNYIELQKLIDEIMVQIRAPTKMEDIWHLPKSGQASPPQPFCDQLRFLHGWKEV